MPADSIADSEPIVHETSRAFVESTNVWQFTQKYDIDGYEELIERTTGDVEGVEESGIEWCWDTMPEHLGIELYDSYDTIRDHSRDPQFEEWYKGGTINIAHNTVDRHAAVDAETRNGVATIREGTYQELHRQSNEVANYLDGRGVGEGDTVGLYMPMGPMVVSILYDCFKVGAIAVPILSGFGVDATAARIEDPECSVLFTGDGFYRRGNETLLKSTLDEAIEAAETDVKDVVVFDRLGADIPWTDGRDATSGGPMPSSPRRMRTRGNTSIRAPRRCCSTRRAPPTGRKASSTRTLTSGCKRRRLRSAAVSVCRRPASRSNPPPWVVPASGLLSTSSTVKANPSPTPTSVDSSSRVTPVPR